MPGCTVACAGAGAAVLGAPALETSSAILVQLSVHPPRGPAMAPPGPLNADGLQTSTSSSQPAARPRVLVDTPPGARPAQDVLSATHGHGTLPSTSASRLPPLWPQGPSCPSRVAPTSLLGSRPSRCLPAGPSYTASASTRALLLSDRPRSSPGAQVTGTCSHTPAAMTGGRDSLWRLHSVSPLPSPPPSPRPWLHTYYSATANTCSPGASPPLHPTRSACPTSHSQSAPHAGHGPDTEDFSKTWDAPTSEKKGVCPKISTRHCKDP